MSFGFYISPRGISSSILLCAFASLLTGCTLTTTAPDAPIAGPAIHGMTYGGNQPVVGEHVYLMAATISGVGSAGYGLASTSLLNAGQTGHSDSIGAYVLSDSNGHWTFDSAGPTYFYTCPSASTQVYVYAVGGNPGAGTNSAAGFMAALGPCGNLSSSTFVLMNEVSTVAAAYSLSGFATDALHISIPQYSVGTTADTLAQTDLQNAFANVPNLVNVATGAPLTTTPGGNGTPNTAQVITLANILAACINSASSSSSSCTTLLNNAGSTGGGTGTIPTDTATAAINIAHYPYVSSSVMGNLFGLQAASGAPFAGGDSSQPTDFTVAINFTGGGLNAPTGVAIDGSGNAWASNYTGSSISKFSSTGAVISGIGYTDGAIANPYAVAIDSFGNAWTANWGNSTVSKFSSNGTSLSGTGYTAPGLNSPEGIAIDASGNAWLSSNGANTLAKLSNTGTPLSGGSGYTGGGLINPIGMAIDASGNGWAANNAGSTLSKFTSTGTPLSNGGYTGGGLSSPYYVAIDGFGNVWTTGYGNNTVNKFSNTGTALSGTGYTGGGLNFPVGIAVDGSGNVWVTGFGNNTVNEFSNSGAAISPSSGYTGGGLSSPYNIAVDGCGNVWLANFGNSTLTELVGAATPVVTPLPANFILPYSAAASRP